MSQQGIQQPDSHSQSNLDGNIGLSIIGPFKRLLGNKIDDAKKAIANGELLIQDFAVPDHQLTESEIQLLKEYVSKLHLHRNILNGIPRLVEDKLSEPAVVNHARREEFANGIEKHLEKADYRRTLSKVSSLLGMFEQEFHSRKIPMDDVTRPNPTPESTNVVPVDEGEGIRVGNSAGTTPRTINSTHDQFVYDEADYLDKTMDLSYRKVLEQQAAEIIAVQGQMSSRMLDKSKQATMTSEGLESSVETIKVAPRDNSSQMENNLVTSNQRESPILSTRNSSQLPPVIVQEPITHTPSTQGECKLTIPPELLEEIYTTFQRIQVEKDNKYERDQHHVRIELAQLREENQAMRLKQEQSEANNAKYSERRPDPTHTDKAHRNPMPEKKTEPEQLVFTSDGESSEGEPECYDQEAPQYESASKHRYQTGKEARNSRSRSANKRIPHHRPRQVNIDEVRRNLIPFNGTGRFETFQTIFNDEVMENDDIKPFMKAVLLEQNLHGHASRYFYHLEDPMDSIRKTFQDLKKKFGKKTSEMTLHDKFCSLPFHKYDCEQMVTDVADHRKVMAQLEEQKVNINDTRSITAFTKKLPRALNEKVLRYLTVTPGREVAFERVLDIIEAEIEVLQTTKSVFGERKNRGSNEISDPIETIHYANTQPHQNNQQYQQNIGGNRHQNTGRGHQNPSQQNSRQGNPPQRTHNARDSSRQMNPHPSQNPYDIGTPSPKWSIVAWSFPFNTPEQGQKCAACDGPHNSIRCPLSSSEFRKRIQAKNLCARCTLAHNTAQCPKWYQCGYCHGDHCMGGCPLKEKYRNRANIPASCIIKDENSPKKSFRKQGKSGKSSQ